MRTLKITEAEWRVMNLLWECSPQTPGEIIASLGAKEGWRPRTVRTLVDRLVEKGALELLADGKRRYAPAISRHACIRNESRSFVRRVFGGEPASLLLHVIKENKLTKDEINQLKKLLSEKEP